MTTLRKVVRKVKSTRREFPKDGQTKHTPGLSDPLRKFYTSLLSQKPDSKMAIKWCMEHGLLPGQLESIHYTFSKMSVKNTS